MTFYVQATRNGKLMPRSDGATVVVRPGPSGATTLHITPLVAKLDVGEGKGTDMTFEIDALDHKSHRAEVIFYVAQPPLPTEVSDKEFDEFTGSRRAPEIGRAYTDDGYLVWTKNIRLMPVNRGEVAFYARVGSSVRSEIAQNPQGGRKVGFRIRVE